MGHKKSPIPQATHSLITSVLELPSNGFTITSMVGRGNLFEVGKVLLVVTNIPEAITSKGRVNKLF